MFSDDYKIKFIRDNISKLSHIQICETLSIHCRTLSSILTKYNISDDRCHRFCPICSSTIIHKNRKRRIEAEKLNNKCKECENILKIERNKGENNSFYNKRHSNHSKNLISNGNKGRRNSIGTEFQIGNKQLDKKTNYEYWVIKYGREIADSKLLDFSKKISDINSGSGNPMYGKPSPIGSGNGWSGWYKDWYFRSLLELSYMIFIIERFNLNWEKGESIKYRVSYNFNKIARSYFPDFIIGRYMIECKPKSLWKTDVNKLKFENAEKYCNSIGMKFKVVECRKIKPDELITKYLSGDIKFIKKYEDRIKKLIV